MGNAGKGAAYMVAHFLREDGLDVPELTCVCCNCSRERVAVGVWQDRTPMAGERLTHGICPLCIHALYPDIAQLVCPSS